MEVFPRFWGDIRLRITDSLYIPQFDTLFSDWLSALHLTSQCPWVLGKKLILSQFVQLVRHVGDYVSSCWGVDYQQIKHFLLLQGDVKFPYNQTKSFAGYLGRLELFSLHRTQNNPKFLQPPLRRDEMEAQPPQPLSLLISEILLLSPQWLLIASGLQWCQLLFQFLLLKLLFLIEFIPVEWFCMYPAGPGMLRGKWMC